MFGPRAHGAVAVWAAQSPLVSHEAGGVAVYRQVDQFDLVAVLHLGDDSTPRTAVHAWHALDVSAKDGIRLIVDAKNRNVGES